MKPRPFLIAEAALLIFAPYALAKPRGSERGTVTQIVNGTMTLRILAADGVSTGTELLWEGEVFGMGEKVGG